LVVIAHGSDEAIDSVFGPSSPLNDSLPDLCVES